MNEAISKNHAKPESEKKKIKTNRRKPKSTNPLSARRANFGEKTVLANLEFSNLPGWLQAHKEFPKKLVLSAVFKAYRRSRFLSVADAAASVGCSRSAWHKWEMGVGEDLQWRTRAELVENGHFHPEHFGVPGKPLDFRAPENEKPKS